MKKITALLFIVSLSICVSAQKLNFPIKIAQLCDPQLGFLTDSFAADSLHFEQVVAKINKIQPDIVAFAGDMVNNMADAHAIEVFHKIKDKLKAPIIITPGNHDLPDPVSEEGLKKYRNVFGDDFQTADVKGVKIISANSQLWRKAPEAETARQEQQLKSELEASAKMGQRVIILTHVPPFVKNADEKDEYFNLPLKERKRLLKMFEENGVILWLAGHTHNTHHNVYGNIHILNGETTSINFDKHPYGFRLLTLFPDNRFNWDFIPAAKPASTALSKEKAKIDSLEIDLRKTGKPLIGISVGRTQSGGSSVSATYINAVLRAGGIPVLIPATSDGAAIYETVASLDGLIMTGGEDINPLWFEEEPIPELGDVDGDRDEYEIRLIKMAADRNIPMLGICRGEQVINVVLGGTLYQDIPSQRDTVVKHRQDLAGKFASHKVTVLPSTQLASIIGEGEHGVNSFHHQAVKDLAPGLRLAASAPDGVVEAYEAYPNYPIIGVQWHPEILITGDHPKMMNIFKFLIEKASVFKKAKALHTKILSVDTHVDSPMRFGRPGYSFADRESNRTNLPKMQEGYLDGVFLAAYIAQGKRDAESSKKAVERVTEILNSIHREIDKNKDLCELAITPDDLVRIKNKGKKAMFIGIENGYAIGKDVTNLKKFYDLGVRYMTLSHSYDNDICDTSTHTENEWGGLSPFGEKVVKEMNKLGMMVDVSHVGESTFWDVLKITKVPVLCTHSSVKALCKSDRNLTDEQMKALAKNGGVIQICILDEFLTDNPKDATIEDLMRHIDYAVKVAGIDHVGIGSDFDGGGGIPGCQSANELIQITVKLLERGYSEEDIAKIWGGNLLRVLGEVQKAATK